MSLASAFENVSCKADGGYGGAAVRSGALATGGDASGASVETVSRGGGDASTLAAPASAASWGTATEGGTALAGGVPLPSEWGQPMRAQAERPSAVKSETWRRIVAPLPSARVRSRAPTPSCESWRES